MSHKPDDVVLPCGCHVTFLIEDGEPVMMIAPCREDCINLANALELANEYGKPAERRTA